MKFDLQKYNYSVRKEKEGRALKEGFIMAFGFVVIVIVLILTH